MESKFAKLAKERSPEIGLNITKLKEKSKYLQKINL